MPCTTLTLADYHQTVARLTSALLKGQSPQLDRADLEELADFARRELAAESIRKASQGSLFD